MILSQPNQLTAMQAPQSPSPGSPAYAPPPVPQQQMAGAAAPQASPLVQALMSAQAPAAQPQQTSSPLGGLPMGALASLLGNQGAPGVAQPTNMNATVSPQMQQNLINYPAGG